MRKPGPALLVSLALHVGLFAVALIRWPDSGRELVVPSVPVTIVSDTVAEAGPAPIPLPDPVEDTAGEVAPLEEDAPPEPVPPTPEPPAPTPAASPPEPAPKAARKADPAPPTKAPPAKAPPTKTAPPRPTPSRKAEEPGLDLDAVAESLKRPSTPRPAPAAKKSGDSGRGQAAVNMGPAVNALRDRLYRFWFLNCEVEGGDEVVARVQFTLSGAGRVIDGPDLLDRRNDPVWRAAAERAVRAVRAGEPYSDLPEGLYNESIIVTFNAREACRNR